MYFLHFSGMSPAAENHQFDENKQDNEHLKNVVFKDHIQKPIYIKPFQMEFDRVT